MPMTVTYTVIDGGIMSECRNGVERDYMPDIQGNTIALLDNTQTMTETFSYWPYGETKSRTGTTPTPFQFLGTLGDYNDSSTKTCVRARNLYTQKGRWMTTDPIGFDGGGWILYEYVGGSPVTNVDPLGLCTITEAEIIGKCQNRNLKTDLVTWTPIQSGPYRHSDRGNCPNSQLLCTLDFWVSFTRAGFDLKTSTVMTGWGVSGWCGVLTPSLDYLNSIAGGWIGGIVRGAIPQGSGNNGKPGYYTNCAIRFRYSIKVFSCSFSHPPTANHPVPVVKFPEPGNMVRCRPMM